MWHSEVLGCLGEEGKAELGGCPSKVGGSYCRAIVIISFPVQCLPASQLLRFTRARGLITECSGPDNAWASSIRWALALARLGRGHVLGKRYYSFRALERGVARLIRYADKRADNGTTKGSMFSATDLNHAYRHPYGHL